MADGVLRTLAVLIATVALCLLLPQLNATDPLAINLEQRFAEPAWSHPFGTDDLGRDVLSRTLHGAALTVTVSILTLITSLCLGIVLGLCAGYFADRWPDKLISWVADLLTSIPFLVVLAAVLSLTGPGTWRAYGILTALLWVGPARIVRAETRKVLQLPYVLSARAIGATEWHVLIKHVAPATVRTATLFSVGYLPEVIAIEAGLSFMGLGVQPPDPGLGKMIYDGIQYLTSAWWMAFAPAAVLLVIVVVIQLATGSSMQTARHGSEKH